MKVRLTPAEALVAATSTTAEAMGLTGRGVLAGGKRVDLLIVKTHPLEDMSCLERVRAVMKAGEWVVA